MKHSVPLHLCSALLAAALGFTATVSRADSFDDAVTQYLKGFEHCKEAKAHLSAGRMDAAKASLKQYQKLLDEASGINRDILTTSKRGMDGNLKYCQRVSRDVEVEAGMPVMNQALAACDSAQQALQDDKPDVARSQLDQFRSLKAEALAMAPSLNDIFTVKNQVSRCERIESKIAASSKKQEALALALETVQEESAAFATSCQKTLEQLNREKIDDPVLRDARQGQASATSHRQNVQGEKLAQTAFREQPTHPVKQKVDASLKQGDQCMANLNQTITRKDQELAAVKARFAKVGDQVKTASADCAHAQQAAGGTATKEKHATVLAGYEKALKTRNQVRDSLAKDAGYRQYDGWDSVRGIEQGMENLNQCLDATRQQLDRLFAALPVAVPVAAAKPAAAATASTPVAAIPAPKAATASAPAAAQATAPATAPQTAAPAQAAAATAATETKPADNLSGAAASRFSGTIRILNLAPEFALFYVSDGTRPRPAEVIIDRAGFDALIYVGGNGDSITLRNKDNTSHRVTATNESLSMTDVLARLQPRQSRTSTINWPEHQIVTLRADRGALAVSYVANVPSANYQQIKLESAGKDTRFTFSNDKAAKSAYLIMPDTDPLTFTLTQGETKSLAITRKGVPAGSLVVTGE
ncbi:MAG TPA: hypothetical protein VM553_19615 [Dongiaceae bacterium]|nr:hypothetical protein [Dongiaceae bacterium]